MSTVGHIMIAKLLLVLIRFCMLHFSECNVLLMSAERLQMVLWVYLM